jgi:hypothetical protein
MKYINIVIVRLDRTIQTLMKTLDSPIKSGNDGHKNFKWLLAGLMARIIGRMKKGKKRQLLHPS